MTDAGLAAPRPAGTRERILAAALDLFLERGFSRTTLKQIADRLGLTKAAILYHFPSKDHLLTGLAEPLMRELEEVLDRAERLPWAEGRWAVIEGWLDVMLAHRRAVSMLMYDLALVARMPSFARFLLLAPRAHQLVAGPGTGRSGRIRAVQVVAMIGDPTVYFSEVPTEELREEILDGVRLVVGRRGAPRSGRPAGPGPAGGSRPAAGGLPTGRPDALPRLPASLSGELSGELSGDLSGERPAGSLSEDAAGAGGQPGVPAAGHRRPGRPRRLSPELLAAARLRLQAGDRSVPEVAAEFGVSRATLYRYLGDSKPDSEMITRQ